VPEQFWVDKSQCRYTDENGQIQNPTQADCAQAVSAVKAIAIAQAEGQRIYTINQSNAATALPKLPVGGTVGQEIQSAIQAGKEVTFHERGINAHGFSGYGYIITDPDTGGGAYLIEGKGNGGSLLLAIGYLAVVIFSTAGIALLLLPLLLSGSLVIVACLAILSMMAVVVSAELSMADSPCARDIIQGVASAVIMSFWGLNVAATAVSAFLKILLGGLIGGTPGATRTCLS
jgi:hypothetical protein